MGDMFDDLRARASEHGVIPAFKLTDEPGKVTSAFVGLQLEADKPGFGLLLIYDEPANPQRLVVELERLRALIEHPV
jgi:hypothetical protein